MVNWFFRLIRYFVTQAIMILFQNKLWAAKSQPKSKRDANERFWAKSRRGGEKKWVLGEMNRGADR